MIPVWVAAVGIIGATAAVIPVASHPLDTSVSFLPALIAMVAVFDLMLVYLLLGDYRDRGDLRHAVMAGAYVWSLVAMAGYALAFPGAVSQNPPLALTPSMAPYFYLVWHCGFPVLLAAAWAPWPSRWAQATPPHERARVSLLLMSAFITISVVVVAALLLSAGSLPELIVGLDTSRMTRLTAPVVVPVTTVALIVVARGTWRRTGPERWTSVVALACLCDLVLTYLAHRRFSVGWYGGRTLTIIAAGVVLVALQASYRQLKAQAERDAVIDPLTGLYNRRGAYAVLEQMLARSRRSRTPLGVVALDLDWFKLVNDRHGHEVGDMVLAEVGRVLNSVTRTGDMASRMGGEEFLLALDDTDAAGARVAAERLRGLVAAIRVDGLTQTLTASFGAVDVLDSDVGLAAVLSRADAALYLAKDMGRDQVQGAEPVGPDMVRQ